MTNRPAATLCAVAVTVSVLSWNPTSTRNGPPPNPLCATAVGVGGERHGTVIAPCELPVGESVTTIPTTGVSGSPRPTPLLDATVEVRPFFAHRILMHNALISMIP